MPNRRVIVLDGRKQCCICDQWKVLEDFGRCAANSSGRDSRCKSCQRDMNLREQYGITLDQYEQMLVKQGGVCAVCKRLDPSGRPLSVDHSHRTGRIRGLLCIRCNTAAGCVSDDPYVARALMSYLLWWVMDEQVASMEQFAEDLAAVNSIADM